MFSDKYKKDNEKIKLSSEFKQDLIKKMKEENKVDSKYKNIKVLIAVAASLSLIIGGYAIMQKNGDTNDNGVVSGDIDNTEIACMAEFLSYDGKNYSVVRHEFNKDNIDSVKGELLGVTEADTKSNFSSNLVGQEIYTFKGQDESMLIGVFEASEDLIINVYEYIDEYAIKTGSDLTRAINLIDESTSVTELRYDNQTILEDDINFDIETVFLRFSTAKNKLGDKEFMDKFYGLENNEIIGFSISTNGVVRDLDLFRGGYIFYSGFVFELDNKEDIEQIFNDIKS